MKNASAVELGKYIATLRKRMNLSQRELARRSGVADVARVEKGYVFPRAKTLQAIADGLGVDVSQLLIASGLEKAKPLPPLVPYLRSRYSDLSDEAVAEVDAFVARLRALHGATGPQAGEDET